MHWRRDRRFVGLNHRAHFPAVGRADPLAGLGDARRLFATADPTADGRDSKNGQQAAFQRGVSRCDKVALANARIATTMPA